MNHRSPISVVESATYTLFHFRAQLSFLWNVHCLALGLFASAHR